MKVSVVKIWIFIGVMANQGSFLSLSSMRGLEAEIFRGSFKKFLKLMVLILFSIFWSGFPWYCNFKSTSVVLRSWLNVFKTAAGLIVVAVRSSLTGLFEFPGAHRFWKSQTLMCGFLCLFGWFCWGFFFNFFSVYFFLLSVAAELETHKSRLEKNLSAVGCQSRNRQELS